MNAVTYTEIASDFRLWGERFDPHGFMGQDEFDTLTTEAKIAMLVECYGPEDAAPTITVDDEPLIAEWLNCSDASVDVDGDVWVSGPGRDHWLTPEEKAKFAAWRAARSMH